jgi:hypothetical protein
VLIANQHTYEGEFSDGHFCGHGSFTLPTRQTFVGHWKASQLQSPATIIYPDGRKFEGEVDRDLQPSGKGTLHTKHKKCSGTFDKGLLEGKAEILDLHSGEIKFGDFRAGRLDAWVTKEDPRPANPSQNPSSQMANPTTIESVMPQQAKLPSEQKPTNSSSKPVQPATAKQLEKKGGCCFC